MFKRGEGMEGQRFHEVDIDIQVSGSAVGGRRLLVGKEMSVRTCGGSGKRNGRVGHW